VKRIYSDDGSKSAPAWFVKAMLVPAAAILLPCGFIRGFGLGIMTAFVDGVYEVRFGIDALKRIWRSAR
jgi:hypothetical protein